MKSNMGGTGGDMGVLRGDSSAIHHWQFRGKKGLINLLKIMGNVGGRLGPESREM